MDFEGAAKRLAKDQSKLRNRSKKGGLVVSAKAKREADFRRKQQAKLRAQKLEEQKRAEYQKSFITNIQRSHLHAKSLASPDLMLQPTSIWGEGDKIALPPSVLEKLTSSMMDDGSNRAAGNPWIFRVGIPNPEYTFPASPLLATMKVPKNFTVDDDRMGGDDSDSDDDGGDDDNEEELRQSVYLDEMAHKYLAYTHCTVVEFTQDEGHVGIPQPIAKALLDPLRRRAEDRSKEIPATRTVDPAAAAASPKEPSDEDADDSAMDVEHTNNDNSTSNNKEDQSDKTPGHLAYGAFDIPDVPLEITMVRLPKGKKCTLTPTPEAIRNNFYALKDIKLVLEQSLIRTRATMAIKDVVHTWHRGIKYDMTVDKVIPSAFDAITCINTDIEVDIGESSVPEPVFQPADSATTATSAGMATGGMKLGGGQTLGPSSSSSTMPPTSNLSSSSTTATAASSAAPIELIAEPPADQKDAVCTVQLRSSVGTGRRRFDVNTATLKDLFHFVISILREKGDVATNASSIQLVTRFPRRVFALDESNQSQTLASCGIAQGQEMFMVESRS
eukprot:CAMPEP_0119550042 /NCGR_PEP_ID=MMETSP1352-20130426/3647_1 /TAXON_ID=265584 /ORGANISM="Stauroneis constricta, Strain CCMP1120" /LENGTH=557 /DNA_ID=CAMNT_0007595787 /DNA_START=55 /DNA_END=1728 /DNA_ORIENTATION=-